MSRCVSVCCMRSVWCVIGMTTTKSLLLNVFDFQVKPVRRKTTKKCLLIVCIFSTNIHNDTAMTMMIKKNINNSNEPRCVAKQCDTNGATCRRERVNQGRTLNHGRKMSSLDIDLFFSDAYHQIVQFSLIRWNGMECCYTNISNDFGDHFSVESNTLITQINEM